MPHLAMADGDEFDAIRTILAAVGETSRLVGDDTAIIPDAPGTLVVSTDTSVEQVHFRRDWLTMSEIGWRATAAALSDLAAAAAVPGGTLLALTLPPGTSDDELRALAHGLAGALRNAGAYLIGGDFTTAGTISLTVTAFGRAVRPMSRLGASPGDEVWVTGVLGGARAALLDRLDGLVPSPAAHEAFARPTSRHRAAVWLAEHGATAMMDVSDGLAGDVGHLAAASGVRIEVDLDALPIHPSVHGVASRKQVPSREFAAVGGEDYELLFTLPSGSPAGADLESATGVPSTRIGTAREGAGVAFRSGDRLVALEGYRHRRTRVDPDRVPTDL